MHVVKSKKCSSADKSYKGFSQYLQRATLHACITQIMALWKLAKAYFVYNLDACQSDIVIFVVDLEKKKWMGKPKTKLSDDPNHCNHGH